MRQNRHWGRRLAALALTAALTGSAAPALAAGDYWDVARLDWYYDRWIDNGAEPGIGRPRPMPWITA